MQTAASVLRKDLFVFARLAQPPSAGTTALLCRFQTHLSMSQTDSGDMWERFLLPHLQKQINHPSFLPAIDNISVPNYCLKSVARCMIELYNIFISAEFVSHCICGLVTYFSASLAPTSSFAPWAVLRRERDLEGVQTYVSLSLTIKQESFLWSTSLGQ